jgi:hypothetical protein
MPIIQEKFQISAPMNRNDNANEGWVTPDSVQRHFPQTQLQIPPTSIDAATQKNMPLVLAGSTDVTDNVNPSDLKRGFDIHPMLMTDDQYMGDHQDHFYGDVGGFVERNNYLDRA